MLRATPCWLVSPFAWWPSNCFPGFGVMPRGPPPPPVDYLRRTHSLWAGWVTLCMFAVLLPFFFSFFFLFFLSFIHSSFWSLSSLPLWYSLRGELERRCSLDSQSLEPHPHLPPFLILSFFVVLSLFYFCLSFLSRSVCNLLCVHHFQYRIPPPRRRRRLIDYENTPRKKEETIPENKKRKNGDKRGAREKGKRKRREREGKWCIVHEQNHPFPPFFWNLSPPLSQRMPSRQRRRLIDFQ